MFIRQCNQSNRQAWEELIAASPDASSGHLWQWHEAIAAAYGFEPFRLLAEDADGRPLAAAPFVFVRSRLHGNELTSLPYAGYGDICHSAELDSETAAGVDRAIFDYSLELARRLRAQRVQVRGLRWCDSRFGVSTEKVTQHLELASSVQAQFKNLPSERRNRLRRCEKLGLKTEILPATDEQALAEFRDIYAENMRNLGSPTHSRAFFREVAARLREWLSLIMIRYQGKAIAGALAWEYRGSLSLPWSAARQSAKDLYGSNALHWAGICLAIERGCHTFDFGRSSVGSGIYEFKRQWGPKPLQTFWSTFYLHGEAKAPVQRDYLRLASKVWRYAPLKLARLVGPMLRKGISN